MIKADRDQSTLL